MSTPCGYDSPWVGATLLWLEIVDYLKLLWRIVQCFCRVSQVEHGKGCVGWATIERVCCFHQGLLRLLIRQCRFMLHDQPTDI